MKLIIGQVPPEGLDVAYEAPSGLLADAGEGVRATEMVRVEGRAEHEAGGLRVRGRLGTHVALTCSRCLAEFSRPLASDFDVLYSRVAVYEDEIRLSARDLAVIQLEGDTVDLDELAREQLLLELPLAPLCRETCKGLCPRCGMDLNQGDCGCPKEPVDPRFAVLKKLL